MDKKKKQYNVTASSLVDLKAELYRKQETFKQERLSQDAGAVPKIHTKTKKPSIWSKQNEGVSARAQRDVEKATEEENTLNKSRQKLEEKARLYEQMTKGDFPDEETESLYLVDFTQKIIDQKREVHIRQAEKGDRDGEDTDTQIPIPPPQSEDEEWVDYVDALGRSRKCLRKDLPEFQKMDQDLQGTSRVVGPDRTLLSEDMRREMQREQWEREEEEQMKRPMGPIHYENIRDQEARELGVGYFAFSQDEEHRQKQRETLDMLRDQTTVQRSKREQLKEKRKSLLEARLAKVRMRKIKKSKLEPGAEEEEVPIADATVQEDEDKVGDLNGPPPSASTTPKVEVVIQERKDSRPGVPHVREWDRGKEFFLGQWTSRRRDERESEFAPPTSYFTDNKRVHHKRSGEEENIKGKVAFKWSDSQKAPQNTCEPFPNQSTCSQPQQTPQPPHSQTQSLDDLLSFYKHSV
ncbi:coiled-coil domain-containing protein 174 [Electrophorus electricus]|uniref:CCDC174 alpha/beta GRSR domain-containing protein n=1 Tax=Electrophorus electricus TaxID=8005 RepID=A0A4W4F5Z1_ELEEL|nr:coiled-coil domain-containing protein 174 [Electrophorus electricus]